MRRLRRYSIAVGAVAVLTLPTPTAAQAAAARVREFIVVVNEGNPVTSIARDEVSRMFLKRATKWPDGRAVEPVDLPPTDRVRVAFTKVIHHKSVGAVRAFWQQQIFSGRDVPPPERATTAEVIDFVSTHPGAVGYVPAGYAVGAGVKSIVVEGESP